jgi:hypothetical protein
MEVAVSTFSDPKRTISPRDREDLFISGENDKVLDKKSGGNG